MKPIDLIYKLHQLAELEKKITTKSITDEEMCDMDQLLQSVVGIDTTDILLEHIRDQDYRLAAARAALRISETFPLKEMRSIGDEVRMAEFFKLRNIAMGDP